MPLRRAFYLRSLCNRPLDNISIFHLPLRRITSSRSSLRTHPSNDLSQKNLDWGQDALAVSEACVSKILISPNAGLTDRNDKHPVIPAGSDRLLCVI